MPAAYSADIRGRVIASVESGSSRREAAEEVDVSALSKTYAIIRAFETGKRITGLWCPNNLGTI